MTLLLALLMALAGYSLAQWRSERDRRIWLEDRLVIVERQRDEAIQQGRFAVVAEPEPQPPSADPLPRELRQFVDGYEDPAARAEMDEYLRDRLSTDPALSLETLRAELAP